MQNNDLEIFDFKFKTMGCPGQLKIYAKNKTFANNINKSVIRKLNQMERYYSNYSQNSFVAKINKTAGNKDGIYVDKDTAILLDYADECYSQSDGLFDITAGALRKAWDYQDPNFTMPNQNQLDKLLENVGWEKIIWDKPKLTLPYKNMNLDFGGIVKEYAVDTIANLCCKKGIKHGLVNLGGDIKIIGPHPDNKPWKIGIPHPREKDKEAAIFQLYEGGLASSGDYERCVVIDGKRYSHILNPKTAHPCSGISAVTVIANHCLVAGSLATISMLKGKEGYDWLIECGTNFICFDMDGNPINSLAKVS